MIETQIPKDIRKYEAKLIGPFTLRQLVSFIIACVVAYIVYFIMKSLKLEAHTVPACMLCAAPVLAFGYVHPYGLNLEQFLKTALISTLLAPTERKYKTSNNFRCVTVEHKKISDSEYKKRLKKDKQLAKENSAYEAFK